MTPEEDTKREALDRLAAEKELQLGEIVSMIKDRFPASNPKEHRQIAMNIIRELHEDGLVRAGYQGEAWPGTINEVLQRIEREWSKEDGVAHFTIFFKDLRKPPAK